MKKFTLACIATLVAMDSMTIKAQIFQIEKNDGSIIELEVNNIKEMRFKSDADPYEDKTPDNVEIVDMGLSVNWASMNVGAASLGDCGYYVSWGETATKSWYSWSGYEFGSSASALTKYNQTDGLNRLQFEDDAARVVWGGDWRMPTRDEFQELIDNCDIDYNATEDGCKGIRLTSRVKQGASIFLPAGGWFQDGSPVSVDGLASYWTSECVNMPGQFSMPSFAFTAEFWLDGDYANTCQINGTYRYLGRNVRAVVENDGTDEPVVEENCAVWDGATSTTTGAFEGDFPLNDDITMTLLKNSALFQPVFQGNYFLLRSKNSMTIKGDGLKKIVITLNPDAATSTADRLMIDVPTYSTSDDLKTGIWEGDASEVTFTATGAVQVVKVEVYY